MGGVIALGIPTVFATMATGPVWYIRTLPPTRTRRGAASRSRFPGLSLSYQPYPRGRKGGSTPASTTSLDKFIHNLFGDFLNRDFATGNLFLIAVCRNMLRIFRPWEIFKGCGWNGPTRFDDLSHSLEIESNFV